MTENEAIEELKYDCNELGKAIPCDTSWGESFENAYAMAIKALKEVQQYRKHGVTVESALNNMCDLTAAENLIEEYRAIGTPEECRKSVDICKAMAERRISLQNMEDYMKFEDECVKRGFTFNSLLKAREKQTAKRPITYEGTNRADCPVCGETVRGLSKQWGNWCSHCGQKLDWGMKDE